jgi:hypothetical protein
VLKTSIIFPLRYFTDRINLLIGYSVNYQHSMTQKIQWLCFCTVHRYAFLHYLKTKIVIFSYPKLLSFSLLTFIKWRLTPSYAAKDTIFWQKRPKTIVIGIIVQDNKNSNLFIWPSMWTRLEHVHWLETINNKWFLGKRESVNAWKKADFNGFREKDE